jgi:hypothetical protein
MLIIIIVYLIMGHCSHVDRLLKFAQISIQEAAITPARMKTEKFDVHQAWVRAALALTTVIASGSANAVRQDVYLVNDSGRTITEAHMSPWYSSRIGQNVLGDRVLRDGRNTLVRFDEDTRSCEWDLTVVFRNGDTSFGRHNLCDIAHITVRGFEWDWTKSSFR